LREITQLQLALIRSHRTWKARRGGRAWPWAGPSPGPSPTSSPR
jgi:hypothetical protein